MMRQRAQERKTEEMEVMELEDEGRSGEESESESEYEEYTDSEDEMEPRLKPVFIRKWVMWLHGTALGGDSVLALSRSHCCGFLSPPPPQGGGSTSGSWAGQIRGARGDPWATAGPCRGRRPKVAAVQNGGEA